MSLHWGEETGIPTVKTPKALKTPHMAEAGFEPLWEQGKSDNYQATVPPTTVLFTTC